MDEYAIALGTLSEQKLEYLLEVLKELEITARVVSVDAESKISPQPTTSKETLQGSINRALRAFEIAKDHGHKAVFSIGIEVGYEKNEYNRYDIFCWSSIADGSGCVVSKMSHKFPMPSFFRHALDNGHNVYEYLDEYSSHRVNGEEKLIAGMIKSRKPFIAGSARLAITHYLNSKNAKKNTKQKKAN
jgi:non-canonical (house-cleaning) NTP pyrophosphatase